ncbi:MAG: hypothetical protein Kow00109_14700 [Acidobacteriota bacterium]
MLLATGWVWAHPEFQKFVEEHSGRNVDCALCHRHPDGPEGMKEGQIGSLTPEEIEQLTRARAAFEPGTDVTNPLLNDFGNLILRRVGKRQFLLLRAHPDRLPEFLDPSSDLDEDGIPDTQEYLDGTHPLKATSGNPWRLFVTNAARHRFDLLMLFVATVLGVYGLNRLERWFAAQEAGSPETSPGWEAGAAPLPNPEISSGTGGNRGT